MKTNFVKNIFTETLKKKSIYRIFTNQFFQGMEFGGDILDIGGTAKKGSHYRYMKIEDMSKIKTVDIDEAAKPDIVLNIESAKLPIDNNSFENVFAFNVIEHLSNPTNLVEESHRVLKDGGKLVCVVPFLVNVHPDPHDFARYTDEKLHQMMISGGFSEVRVSPIGYGPFIAGYSHQEFVCPRILRLIVIPSMFLLDWILKVFKPNIDYKSRFPLAYAVIAKK